MTVIDGATNTTTAVAAGDFPDAVAVNPVTNKIYVANQSSNDVTVIDGATNATTTVTVGSYSRCRCGEPGHQQDLRRQPKQQHCDGDRWRHQQPPPRWRSEALPLPWR